MKVDDARAWMKENAAAHANSKQIDQTNKQLHTSLRREMERAKQVSPFVANPSASYVLYSWMYPVPTDSFLRKTSCESRGYHFVRW